MSEPFVFMNTYAIKVAIPEWLELLEAMELQMQVRPWGRSQDRTCRSASTHRWTELNRLPGALASSREWEPIEEGEAK